MILVQSIAPSIEVRKSDGIAASQSHSTSFQSGSEAVWNGRFPTMPLILIPGSASRLAENKNRKGTPPTACPGYDTLNRKQKRQKQLTNPALGHILLHEVVVN